jgi:hypothetical protein
MPQAQMSQTNAEPQTNAAPQTNAEPQTTEEPMHKKQKLEAVVKPQNNFVNELLKINFPKIAGLNRKEEVTLSNLFRWFVLYRFVTRDGIPRPAGTLMEAILMLDLCSAAWLDYCIREDIREQIHQVLSARYEGDFGKVVQILKTKLWSIHCATHGHHSTPPSNSNAMSVLRARPSAIEKARQRSKRLIMLSDAVMEKEELDAVFRWFSVYRELSNDFIPDPKGSLFEIVCMCELIEPAFYDLRFNPEKQDFLTLFHLPHEDKVSQWARSLRGIALTASGVKL